MRVSICYIDLSLPLSFSLYLSFSLNNWCNGWFTDFHATLQTHANFTINFFFFLKKHIKTCCAVVGARTWMAELFYPLHNVAIFSRYIVSAVPTKQQSKWYILIVILNVWNECNLQANKTSSNAALDTRRVRRAAPSSHTHMCMYACDAYKKHKQHKKKR